MEFVKKKKKNKKKIKYIEYPPALSFKTKMASL